MGDAWWKLKNDMLDTYVVHQNVIINVSVLKFIHS